MIAGLLDMIPNIGATIAGFVIVPALWAEEGLTAALIMLAAILVCQQLENNITPKIQGKAVQLSAFFIIVSVTLSAPCSGSRGADRSTPRRDDPDPRAGADEGTAGARRSRQGGVTGRVILIG